MLTERNEPHARHIRSKKDTSVENFAIFKITANFADYLFKIPPSLPIADDNIT
ncbi:MAG: hypothetical protein GY821_10070 [Gammaproteobacteria bacterium]|nr:hypothetical protein [Gammaproteobacteria bacterium]